jgi:hypothetical protein
MLQTFNRANVLVFLLTSCLAVAGRAQVRTPHNNPVGLTTDLISLKQGQVANLDLKNTGKQPVAARLQFVDKDGKVLAQKDVTIKRGGNETFAFPFVGGPGPNRESVSRDWTEIQLRAQFQISHPNPGNRKNEEAGIPVRDGEKSLIDLLQPRLRIIESSSRKNIQVIGPEGFVELRPGNDPRSESDEIRPRAPTKPPENESPLPDGPP